MLAAKKSKVGRRRRTIDFFQSQLLGLPDEEEDHGPCNQIKTRIETESTGRSHNSSHTGEGYTEDTGYRWSPSAWIICRGALKTYRRSC